MKMTESNVFRRALMLAGLGLLAGCSELDNCPDGRDPIVIDGGHSDPEAHEYTSASFGGPLDAFPAKTELVFEHGLGVAPLDVHTYLSFKAVGTNDERGGSVAESAGNQALIECVDSRVIVVKNDTCEPNFFIRVTASGVGTDDGDCGY